MNASEKVGLKNVVALSPNSVVLPKYNIRQSYDGESLSDLQKSVSENGTIYPIIVRQKDNAYELIAGSRRLRAAQQLGLKLINAIVLSDVDDRRSLEIALIENIQREDLTPFEEARVILKFVNDYKMALKDIAQKLGKSVPFVRSRLQFLSLPADVQKLVAERKLSLSQAMLLTSFDSDDEQIELAKEIVEDDLSQDEAETLIKEARKQKPTPGKEKTSAIKLPKRFKKDKVSGKKIRLKIVEFNNWLCETLPQASRALPLEQERIRSSLAELSRKIDQFLKK
jgi:ParB family chromosome partitioning protein